MVYDEDAMDVDLGLLEDADGNKKGQVRGGSSRGWGKDGGGGEDQRQSWWWWRWLLRENATLTCSVNESS